MILDFEPTKKAGNFIYRVYGRRRDWFMDSGRPATEAEAFAIAQGAERGRSVLVHVQVGLLQTTRDTARAIGTAFSTWAQSAPAETYGGRSPFSDFVLTRSGAEPSAEK
jgi:hypothetical protein